MGCVGGVSKCGDDCVTICVENTFIYLLSLYFHKVSLCDREEKFWEGDCHHRPKHHHIIQYNLECRSKWIVVSDYESDNDF